MQSAVGLAVPQRGVAENFLEISSNTSDIQISTTQGTKQSLLRRFSRELLFPISISNLPCQSCVLPHLLRCRIPSCYLRLFDSPAGQSSCFPQLSSDASLPFRPFGPAQASSLRLLRLSRRITALPRRRIPPLTSKNLA